MSSHLLRSAAIIFRSSITFGNKRCVLNNRLMNSMPNLMVNRSVCTTSMVRKKKNVNPEEEVLVKSAKTERNKRIVKKRPKSTVWGVVDIYRGIDIQTLASSMNRSIEIVQQVLTYFPQVVDTQPNAKIDSIPLAKEIAAKCGYRTRITAPPDAEVKEEIDLDVYPRPPAPPKNLKPRPPVVTVMGHVDHGKTTLLDNLRGASVVESEAGGITQHIGAFTVDLENGESVTFLDTPGHAAFSSMRARGAHCTDIIVLVVAAEDGVMPQTKEVLNLAREGNVPLVVAINKIDAPGANIEAAKNGLLKAGVNLEGYGGDVQCVCISALHGTNLDHLSDAIVTQAALMDLKSEYTGLVEGVVIESKTDPRRGKLSTMIVTRGTLRKGSVLVAGTAYAKVRGLFDHNIEPINEVTPGVPVEITGWRELPAAGDLVLEVENEKHANTVIKYREHKALIHKAEDDLDAINEKREGHNKIYKERRQLTKKQKSQIIEKTYAPEDPTPKLNIIIKVDVHGSLEAILDVFNTYDCSEMCRLNIVHHGVGTVTDSDIELAKTFDAVIYGFSIRMQPSSEVVMREFNIIYRLFEDVIAEINNRLPEIDVDDVVGEAEVQQIFMINERNKKVPVMGCRCMKGNLKKNLQYKILRDDEIIYDGKLSSMRHMKNEVDTIKKGVDCGLQLADKTVEAEPGDKVICYTIKKERQEIDWNPGFHNKN
ncbi:translation initiation factor IF-2, mitochondrial [Contarinia nasturtii]|uniref:translation initiation factor IF-2, mitochondrial n=1 Tax=Contarinia nasturtii TaxID=265458 RepID=UPI0012D470C4|nr:translation initiation factor IF-2, mitochondrial [Contarinia nasturtii]